MEGLTDAFGQLSSLFGDLFFEETRNRVPFLAVKEAQDEPRGCRG